MQEPRMRPAPQTPEEHEKAVEEIVRIATEKMRANPGGKHDVVAREIAYALIPPLPTIKRPRKIRWAAHGTRVECFYDEKTYFLTDIEEEQDYRFATIGGIYDAGWIPRNGLNVLMSLEALVNNPTETVPAPPPEPSRIVSLEEASLPIEGYIAHLSNGEVRGWIGMELDKALSAARIVLRSDAKLFTLLRGPEVPLTSP